MVPCRRGVDYFKMDLSTMPQSGMTGYYFPYNQALNGYDTSSYNSSYSENTISQAEVVALINEVNSLPETPVSRCSFLSWMQCLLSFICMAGVTGCSLGIMVSLERTKVVQNPNGTYSTVHEGIPTATGIIIMAVIDIALIAATTIAYKCIGKCIVQKALARKNAINQVVMKYQPQFYAKNSTLRLSTHGAYIALEFKWRAAAGMMQLQAMQMQAAAMMQGQVMPMSNMGMGPMQNMGMVQRSNMGMMPTRGPGIPQANPYQPAQGPSVFS